MTAKTEILNIGTTEKQYKELEEAEKNRKNYILLEEYGRSRGLE